MHGIKEVWLFANNIIRTARKLVNERLKKMDLSSAEGNILVHLLAQGDGVRQENIVAQLDISKPAVSRALDSLEAKSYVLRIKDETDKRASRVLLTDRARSIGSDIMLIYDEVFNLAAQGLSEEEISSFIELFGRVSENLTGAEKTGGNNVD